MNACFVTWYPYCRRSDTIAAALNAPSHLIHYLGFRKPLQAPVKYVLQFFATLRVLYRERPDLVFVAVPPVFAALPVCAFARTTGAKVVIDAHTGTFDHARWKCLRPLTRRVFRRADAVIVTNEHLARTVRTWGARPAVIGTVPVRFDQGVAPDPCQQPRVVVVNSFAVDEPVGELLEAARRLDGVRFFVTGDTSLARRAWLDDRPSNLRFTGFLSEAEYAGLLRSADLVVVLTTHDHTMQRGAYEAVALEKPLVTSDWGILREAFSKGTVHVANDTESIRRGIDLALRDRERLAEEMKALRSEQRANFDAGLRDLLALLEGGASAGEPARGRAASA